MFLLRYLIIINLIAAIIFSYDKYSARHKKERVPEKILHLLELCGGVWSMLPLMYIIHHKNKKASYYRYTHLIFIIWIIVVILLAQ